VPKFTHRGDTDVDLYAPAGSPNSLPVGAGQTVDVPGKALGAATRTQLKEHGVLREEDGKTVDATPEGMAYYVLPDGSLELMPNDATYVELPNGDVRAFPHATWAPPETKKPEPKGEKSEAKGEDAAQATGR